MGGNEMGNEISTIGGGIATVATAAAGATFGQVDALNSAVKDTAKFTGKSFMKTNVRHIGQTTGVAFATTGTAVAAGVCMGQVDALNQSVVTTAKLTASSGVECGKTALETLSDTADSLPGVGHAKGGIHYL